MLYILVHFHGFLCYIVYELLVGLAAVTALAADSLSTDKIETAKVMMEPWNKDRLWLLWGVGGHW